MKIVCDACSAKYSIADEKVRGKVFKIRCKKCSNIIVVRGGTPEGEQPQFDQKETKVFDYAGYDSPSSAAAAAEDGGGDWHVVVDQEQVGPLTEAEIAERFSRGEINADTYVWREGFGDWERLAAVEAFAALAGGGGAPVASEDLGAAMFGGPAIDESGTVPQSDPGDLFAAATGGDPGEDPGADLFGDAGIGAAMASTMAVGSEEDDAGLFASGNGSAAVEAEGGAAASAASLTGQRNENSVLFSLNNLAALASDAPRAAAAPISSGASGGGGSVAPGGGVTEGSGLIDIRSMAQVYLGDRSGAAAGPSAGTGSVDDLPVFSQASFEAAAPVLLPTAAPANNNKIILALVGAIGVLAIAAIVLVVVVLKGSDTPTQVAAADQAGAAATAPTSEVPGAAAAAAGDEGQPGAAAAAEGKEEEDEEDEEEAKPEPTAKPAAVAAAAKQPDRAAATKQTAAERRQAERERRETARAAPEKKPPPARESAGGCDEVSCLVDPSRACCRKYRSGSPGGGGGGGGASSSLPEAPTRPQIQSGMSRVQGAVASCGSRHNYSGMVTVRVRIGGDGKVGAASVTKGGGGAVNGCVTAAVRRASFPRSQRGVTVNYPFRL